MLHLAKERLNLPTVSSSCWSWKEEALDDFPWKDERGPSGIRKTLEPFQRQHWGNFWEMGCSACGLFQAHMYHPAEPGKETKSNAVAGQQMLLVLTVSDKPEMKGRRRSKSWQLCAKWLTWGKVMLMRLNRLCRRLEMTIRPPPGGPMAAMRNMSCWKETIRGERSKAQTRQASRLCVLPKLRTSL